MLLLEKAYFTLPQIATRWHCSCEDVYHFVETGKLQSIKLSVLGRMNLGIFKPNEDMGLNYAVDIGAGIDGIVYARDYDYRTGYGEWWPCWSLNVVHEELVRFEKMHGIDTGIFIAPHDELVSNENEPAKPGRPRGGLNDVLEQLKSDAIRIAVEFQEQNGRLPTRDEVASRIVKKDKWSNYVRETIVEKLRARWWSNSASTT